MNKRLPIRLESHQVEVFCQRHGITHMRLFGSVLRADFGPASDVDVLVEFAPGKTPGFFGLSDMEAELSVIMDGRRIDLNTVNSFTPPMRGRILKDAEEIYAA
jgi:predicted nucleotidyltransferase